MSVTWYLQLFRDYPQARRTLKSLRRADPLSPVLVVSDGDPDPRMATFTRTFSAQVVYGERLFTIEHGGEVCQRMLALFLETPSDVLIKIDPDTLVRRPWRALPSRDEMGLYGQPQRVGGLDSIQGGCIIVPRRAAQLLRDSNVLLSPELKGPMAAWARGDQGLWERANVIGLTSHDWTLGWACRELGITIREHPEVLSRWRRFSPGDGRAVRQAAVLHPRPRPVVWLPLQVRLSASSRRWRGRVRRAQDRLQGRLLPVQGFYRRTRPSPIFHAADQELRRHFTPTPDGYRELFRYFVSGYYVYKSPAGARAHYPGAPSDHGRSIDGIEGFTRMLPFLCAWIRGGGPTRIRTLQGRWVDLLESSAEALTAGVDPRSPEWWGSFSGHDQRIVEAADVALALWLGRDSLWRSLVPRTRQRLVAWLFQVNRCRVPDNNWHLFIVLVNAVLKALGEAHAPDRLTAAYQRFKTFYLGAGWFGDGPVGRVDYYNAWQMHYTLGFFEEILPELDRGFLSEARREFLATLPFFIGPRGFPALGRSLCYRLAISAPLICDDTLGVGRRALDVTWSHFLGGGAVQWGRPTQGLYGTDLRLLDSYSGPASPLWGLRSLVAAFRMGERFWSRAPEKLPIERGSYELPLPVMGWLLTGDASSQTITLTQAGRPARLAPHGPSRRLWEALRGRPRRPVNTAVTYELPEYRSGEELP